jgi:hypothetical protein
MPLLGDAAKAIVAGEALTRNARAAKAALNDLVMVDDPLRLIITVIIDGDRDFKVGA